MTISFFDCNATIGRAAAPILGSYLEADALLGEMDDFGIDQALINHVYAQEVDYRVGNEEVARASADSGGRLAGAGVLAPSLELRGSNGEALSYVDELIDQGFRAFRLDPNPTHHIMDASVYGRQYAIAEETVGAVLDALSVRRAPLFLELAQVTWPEVYATCRDHADLPVVLLNVTYPHKRSLFAGLDRYPNLYCDTSSYHAFRGIEEITELFGSSRLLFGTRLPVYNALAAIGNVMYAAVSEPAREAIAGGNLRLLLAEVQVGSQHSALGEVP